MTRKSVSFPIALVTGAIAIAALALSSARAADIDAEFRLGYVQTDNVFLVPEDGVEDRILTVGASLEFLEETNRTNINIRGVADYLDYEDTFDAEWIGGIDALLEYAIVQEKFNWVIQNNFGQRELDPLSAPNPGNREDINFFSTGPDFRLPLGQLLFAALEARYSMIGYEVTDQDNDRVSAGVFLGRDIGGRSSISLGATTQSVDYADNSTFDDFDIHEAIVRYEVDSPRNVIGIDIGYTELDLVDLVGDGYLVRIDWRRVSNESYQFFFSAGSEYSTTGDIFRFRQTNGREVGTTIDTNANDAPFRSHYFLSRFEIEKNRTQFLWEVEWNQEDFEFPPLTPGLIALDRDILRSRVGLERELTRRMYLQGNLTVRNTKFKYFDREDHDFFVTLRFGYNISDAFSVFVGFSHNDRESNDSSFAYTENRYAIGFAYVPTWAR